MQQTSSLNWRCFGSSFAVATGCIPYKAKGQSNTVDIDIKMNSIAKVTVANNIGRPRTQVEHEVHDQKALGDKVLVIAALSVHGLIHQVAWCWVDKPVS
eukprot:2598662-Amphidinium_carterae.1